MAKRILIPFADSGDRSPVSDDTQSSGEVSYQQGYTPSYSLNPATDASARRLNRDRYNQIQHDITDNIKEWQEQLAPNFITAAVNGGAAFSYPLGMIVFDGTGYRRSLVANNTADVSDDSQWSDYDFDTQGQGKNLLYGLGRINQEEVTGTVALSLGEYGHDGFRGGSAGCSYTFTESEGVTTFTILSGSLVQEVEGRNFTSGTFVLSWTGTAQGRINSDPFGASGVTSMLTGGTNATVEWNTGTLSLMQLETGLSPTDFEWRSISEELFISQFYLYVPDSFSVIPARKVNSASAGNVTSSVFSLMVNLPRMRIVPVISGISPTDVQLRSESGGTVTTCNAIPTITSSDLLSISCSFPSTDVTEVTQIRFLNAPLFDARL